MMISVESASEIIQSHCNLATIEHVGLEVAQGRVLAEEIKADRDFPPFNRVTMDGIAIRFDSLAKTDSFEIEGIAAAGGEQRKLEQENGCFEVMTGAMLPIGTDTVIRIEDLAIEDNTAKMTIDLNLINKKQNVHHQGSDREKNSVIIQQGKIINAPELGILATCGYSSVSVRKLPSVAVISSGDELVAVNEIPLPHQIRRSNNYSIAGALRELKVKCDFFHLKDDLAILKKELEKIIDQYDVLILSGGVSMGKFDLIPQALSDLKVEQLFHKIKQRPGKPFWFGMTPNNQPVFALPGNPVSSFMCTHKYILPWFRKHLGTEYRPKYAALASDIRFKPDLTYFAQVKLNYEPDGKVKAWPVEGNGSGDLANLTESNAFIELVRGKDIYTSGETYEIIVMNP